MKFALVNPNWSFDGSIYFGCWQPHVFHLGLEGWRAADQRAPWTGVRRLYDWLLETRGISSPRALAGGRTL